MEPMFPFLPEMQTLFKVVSVHPMSTRICCNRDCTSLSQPVYQCSACFSVGYCSEKHQLEDWTNHRKTCHPMIKRQSVNPNSPEFGPYQANRPLDSDTVVLNLSPIMMGPSLPPSLNSTKRPGMQLCISCCVWYPSGRGAFACQTCGWPVCSNACSKNLMHASNECKIFRDAGVKPRSGGIFLDGILALRCLLLQKTNPEAFKCLWDSSEKFARMKRSLKAEHEDDMIARFLLVDCKLKSLDLTPIKLDIDNILLFLKVVEACTLAMSECQSQVFRKEGGVRPTCYISAKYVIPEKFNIKRHCSPNMRWVITSDQDLKSTYITFRTTHQVAPDDFLTAAWGNETEQATVFRQSTLTSRFTEPCSCSRCLDPSENQTEFNTVRCRSCKNVSLRPLDPTNRKSYWKCSVKQCRDCRREVPALPILQLLREIHYDLISLRSDDAKYPAKLLQFIEDRTDHDKIIHPKHFLAILAATHFIRYITTKIKEAKRSDELDITLLITCEKFIDMCLEIHPALVPGNTEIRGRLLYQKQAVMSFRCLQDAHKFMTTKVSSLLPQYLLTLSIIQDGAYNGLKYCPVGTTSHFFAMKLKKFLEELRELFLYQCIPRKTLDRTLAAQLYNMFASMSDVTPMIVPNPPWDGSSPFNIGPLVIYQP